MIHLKELPIRTSLSVAFALIIGMTSAQEGGTNGISTSIPAEHMEPAPKPFDHIPAFDYTPEMMRDIDPAMGETGGQYPFVVHPNPFEDHIVLRSAHFPTDHVKVVLRHLPTGTEQVVADGDARLAITLKTPDAPRGPYVIEVYDVQSSAFLGARQMIK